MLMRLSRSIVCFVRQMKKDKHSAQEKTRQGNVFTNYFMKRKMNQVSFSVLFRVLSYIMTDKKGTITSELLSPLIHSLTLSFAHSNAHFSFTINDREIHCYTRKIAFKICADLTFWHLAETLFVSFTVKRCRKRRERNIKEAFEGFFLLRFSFCFPLII